MERGGGGGRRCDMELSVSALAPAAEGVAPAVRRERSDEAISLSVVPDAVELAGTGFDAFYRRARPDIARALAVALGDVDLATEATDEALARAYERWSTVSALDRPEAWTYRVAQNWAFSILRRRRRGERHLYGPGTAGDVEVADPAVHAALAELDVKQRSVVVCRHLLGWSVADTAAALGIREGTVKSRLHRASRLLHTRLAHLADGADR